MPIVYIGIDDTDFGDSIGTGALARELQIALMREFPIVPKGVTRHQLLVHPDIPYTSHNSAACLKLQTDATVDALTVACERFVAFLHHEGADPGLCVFTEREMPNAFYLFGQRATSEVVTKQEAIELGRQSEVVLRELGGAGIGIIGAIAACALRMTDNDGRFLSLPGAFSLADEVSIGELLDRTPIDRVVDEEGNELPRATRIVTNRWVRPDLVQGQAVLRVAKRADGYVIRKRHDAD